MVGLVELESIETVEDEEWDLVLKHDHVTLEGVHCAAHGEDGVVAGVTEGLEAFAGGATEEFEKEAAVEEEHEEEIRGREWDGGVVAGSSPVFKRVEGVEVKVDGVGSAAEDVVEGTPFVAVHFTKTTLGVVVRTNADELGDVGFVVAVAEGFGDTVDGVFGPGGGGVIELGLSEVFLDGDEP